MPWHRYSLTGRFSVKEVTTSTVPQGSIDLLKALILMTIDVVLCFILTVSCYYFISWCIFVPYDRGFYCDDVSIRNDLYTNTVPTMYLLAITLGLPLPIIFASTAISSYESTRYHKHPYRHFFQTHLHDVIRKSTFAYLDYVIGFFILTLSLDIIKCCVGRLRPNFIAMCKPANLSLCDKDPLAYIPQSMCTAEWRKARNSRMSFPSGHAAATIFAWIFIIKYLCGLHHLSAFYSRLFRYTTILLFTAFSIFCCVSRVTDFWHFPTDVIGGIIISIAMFYITLRKYS